MLHIASRAKLKDRSRVLSEAEMVEIWHAVEGLVMTQPSFDCWC